MKVIVDNYLFEALKPSEFRKLMQVGRDLAMERIGGIWGKLKSQADSTNRNGDRLFFEISASPLEDKLHSYLKANNYEIVDYKGGLVRKVGDKNNVKIVKVLTMLGKNDPTASKLQRNYELLKSVNKLNDYDSAKSESASPEDYTMVISKSPYDLGGMSTDREWDSCMDLRDGSNRSYVPVDVERGTLVSYLVNPTDKNIENPIARILIKPYLELDNQDEVLYGIQHDQVYYGKDNPEYVKTLVNLLDKAQGEKTGIFKLDDRLYHDAGKQFAISNPNDVPPERILEHFKIQNYTIKDDGTVDVNESVHLSEKGLTEIPIKFGVVKGNFDISGNNLLSLKNCPRIVNGIFKCSGNKQLSSLKKGPKIVESYWCFNCDLKSLEGAPNEVTGEFNCSFNRNLTSLKDGPKIVGNYNCSYCNIESSEGIPDEITGDFYGKGQRSGYIIRDKNFTYKYAIQELLESYGIKYYTLNDDGSVDVLRSVDLSGKKLTEIPIKFGFINGNFYINNNNLSSLKNSPREMSGIFSCSGNKNLTSLEDGPENVYSYFCNNCNLESLVGAPTQVTDKFDCSNNKQLSSLNHAPKTLQDFDCSGCNLTSLKGAPNEVEFFDCSEQVNGHKFTDEDVEAVCNASDIFV
jgi:hypothetical protein